MRSKGLPSGLTASTVTQPPAISSLSPASATAGGAAFTLSIIGNNFTSASTLKWGSVLLRTSYISAARLSAAVPASLIATPGTASITVITAAGNSSSAAFTITLPPPAITSLNPATAIAGRAFTMTINGRNFFPLATARWGSAPLVTTYVSATQITAAVPANLVAAGGRAFVTVSTAGGISPSAALAITQPAPSITSLSPGSVMASATALTLTINGANFLPGVGATIARWNNVALATTYVNSGQLTVIVPASLIDPIGKAMLNIYPTNLVNAGNSGTGYNYVNEPVRTLNETKFDARLDHTLSTKDNLFGRLSYDQATSFVPGGAPGLAEASAFGSSENLTNHARNIGIGWNHVFSPRALNQATLGYDRIFDYIASIGNYTCESAILGIPGADLGCSASGASNSSAPYSEGLVSAEVTSGYWALGDRGYSPFQGGTNIYSFKDDLDLIRGKHEIHAGIDLRDNQLNVGTAAFGAGFWLVGTFGNFSGGGGTAPGDPEADLLMGIAGGAIHDQTYGGAVTGRRWKIYRPFVEDDWRVTPSLTLNLGLAWDMTTPIVEEHNRMSDYIPSTGQLLIAGQNGVSRSAGINMFWGAYEPRVGLTWKVLGSDKTVVRLGFGIYHDSSWNQGAQGLWQNPPNLGESDVFPATFSAGCAFSTSYCATTLGQSPENVATASGGFPLLPTPQNVASFVGTYNYQPTNFQPGRVHQYNANVERQLPGNVLLTAGYAGSVGGHLLVIGNAFNVNSPSACGTVSGYTIGCLPSGAAYSYPYPAPNYNTILIMGDVGKTHYNSMQLKAETKAPKYGLYALVAYTYSRTYDNGLSDGLGSELSAPYFPLPNWENLDWALSQINLDQSFTGSVIYDLPFGHGRQFGSSWNNVTNAIAGNWQMTLIERISSGFPVPLIDSNNQSGTTFNSGGDSYNYNRPDQVANCNVYKVDHAVYGKHQWINPGCFAAPAAGKLGNASRVPVVGPDFVNTDFSLIKQFALPRKDMGLNFRAEFFNLFNHTQYGMPVQDFNAPGFGAISSTVNNPRLIQLALKLSF